MKIIITLLALGIVSCSSPATNDRVANLTSRERIFYDWAKQVQEKVGPIWRAEIKRQAKDNATQLGERISSLEGVSVQVEVTVDREGLVKNTKLVRASGVKFVDEISADVFNKISPLPEPPKICFKNNECTAKWNFILEK